MAAQLGSGGVRSDINVTPLIDVVLVLLIIFMVLTPTLESRFAVALPRTDLEVDVPPPPAEAMPLLVALRQDDHILLNDEDLDAAALGARLRGALGSRHEKVVFFQAEGAVNYGRAVEVMDLCRKAGADHIGIVEPTAAPGELPAAPAATPAVAR